MATIRILDIDTDSDKASLSAPKTLQDHEASSLVGGLDPDSGGLAIIGLGIAAVGVGSVTAPFVAAAGITIGLGLLFRDIL